jgi:hypothetical protein
MAVSSSSCLHVVNAGAPIFYVATIYLICAVIFAKISLLRGQAEISWSHSTIRTNVYNGTSQ